MRRPVSLLFSACGALAVHACVLPHFGTDPSLDEPSSSAGSGGSSDEGGDGGSGATPSAGTAGNGDAGASLGGQPQVPDTVELGEACAEDAAHACVGAAQRERLVCKDGKWAAGEACDDTSNCDQASGECQAIVEGCTNAVPGQRYCAQKALTECGPDLVTTNVVETCTDVCVETGNTAECVPKSCGDKVRQSPEQCDDGNKDDTDACTNACKVAHCGDTAIWKDHETCDDGNVMTEPCAYGAASCTVCNATCQKEAGAVRLCGDGSLQTENEQCEAEALSTQGLCNRTCELATWALWRMPGLTSDISNYGYTADTITDNTTKLMWQRVMDKTERTWQEAQDYCWNLTLANKSDWRAPTRVELLSLVDFTKTSGVAINASTFADALPTERWWSSSATVGGNTGIYLDVETGYLSVFLKTVKTTVRCVR